jgi:hypothetical protein
MALDVRNLGYITVEPATAADFIPTVSIVLAKVANLTNTPRIRRVEPLFMGCLISALG